jgi:hypothetical protein
MFFLFWQSYGPCWNLSYRLNENQSFDWVFFNCLVGWFMVFNATFNNFSVISWQSVLLVAEIKSICRKPSHWQTLSHNVETSTPRLSGIRTHNISRNQTTMRSQSRPRWALFNCLNKFNNIILTTQRCMYWKVHWL